MGVSSVATIVAASAGPVNYQERISIRNFAGIRLESAHGRVITPSHRGVPAVAVPGTPTARDAGRDPAEPRTVV
jgi:hypothetical protein